MTTNERIAEFLGKTVTRPSQAGVGDIVRLASGALFVVDHAGMFTDGYNNAGDPWDPEHDIRCWHGPEGLLATIEERGTREAFTIALWGSVGAGYMEWAHIENVAWWCLCATPPQLAAALVKVIEEAHDA